jgi:hypothetical protein
MTVDDTLIDSQELARGAVVGDFKVRQLISRGTSSFVYCARDLFMQRDVVLKEYFPLHMARRKSDGGLQLFMAEAEPFASSKSLFMMEAIQLSRMNHASVAKVNRVWEAGGTAYVTMPLYPGRMLGEVCEMGEIVPTLAWVEQFVRPLLDFVGSLHRRSIYGVELSVANVMLLESRYPLIMSLGPRFSGRHVAKDSPVVPPQPWSDVQALARMILHIIGPAAGKIQYPRAWMSSLQDAASGEPGRRAANVSELMQFSGLADRRSRSRVAGESALIENHSNSDPGLLDMPHSRGESVGQQPAPRFSSPSIQTGLDTPAEEPEEWMSTTFTALYFDQPEVARAQAQAKAKQQPVDTAAASTTSATVLHLPPRHTHFEAATSAAPRSGGVLTSRSEPHAGEEPRVPTAVGAHQSPVERPPTPAIDPAPNAAPQAPRTAGPMAPSSMPTVLISRRRPSSAALWARRNWATLALALIILLLLANLIATLTA